ncbi:MAG: type 4a pilus biogenesis protein PilO [Candidatus Contubernalis sp.]|nr:type 4a pilus biogenesis protein PilO [Candidatus Contubernalis sp.]
MIKNIKFTREHVVIILSILGILLMIFLIFLQYDLLKDQQQVVEGFKLELKEAELKLEHLQDLKERSYLYYEQLDSLKKMIPNEAEESWILDYLERVSIKSGTKLNLTKFSQRISKSGCTEIPLIITLQGSYSSLTAFLEMIEQGERAFRIDGIKINKDEESSSSIKAEVFVTAFHRG